MFHLCGSLYYIDKKSSTYNILYMEREHVMDYIRKNTSNNSVGSARRTLGKLTLEAILQGEAKLLVNINNDSE